MSVAKRARERKPKPGGAAERMLSELRELEHRLRNLGWPLRLRGDLAREQSSKLQARLRSLMQTTSDLLGRLRQRDR
jgi:hypothetical protein